MWMVVLAVAVSLQTAPAAQRRADTRTWYQAYTDGVRAVQQRNWQAAVDSLEAAKRAGPPRPGRRIPFYGDVYNDFLPDYYLGIAYVNLRRYAEADQAFEAVRASALIGPRDREYQQFTEQARVAKSQLQLAQAAPAATAPPAPVGNAPVTAAPNAAASTVSPPAAAPAPPLTAPNPTGVAPAPAEPPPAGAAIGGSARANEQAARAREAAILKQRDASRNRPNQGVVSSIITPADEQAAISAYLSGQYDRAATLLAGAESGPVASPRAYFYLACSRTALAILGQADAAAVTGARALVARAGDPAQFAADRRYVSPRVLQMLGVAP